MNTASNLSTVTMEQAIRSAITAAVHQVKNKMYEREVEDPVQAFLDDLFAVLFPTPVQAVATMPPLLQRTDTLNHTNCDAACCRSEEVTVPTVPAPAPAPKEKKPRKKAASPPAAVEETPAAAPAPAPKEKKPRKKKETSPAPAPAVVEETPAAPAAVEETPAAAPAPAPKEKKPRKKAEPKPASEAAPAPATPPTAPAPTEAPAAPKKEKKVKSPKPEGVNLDKLTPTQVKKLKAVADELHVELDKKAFLAHLNAMSGPVFGATTLESHYRSFLQPAETVSAAREQEKQMDAVEVEFQGKTYCVDESDMRVYEQKGEV